MAFLIYLLWDPCHYRKGRNFTTFKKIFPLSGPLRFRPQEHPLCAEDTRIDKASIAEGIIWVACSHSYLDWCEQNLWKKESPNFRFTHYHNARTITVHEYALLYTYCTIVQYMYSRFLVKKIPREKSTFYVFTHVAFLIKNNSSSQSRTPRPRSWCEC